MRSYSRIQPGILPNMGVAFFFTLLCIGAAYSQPYNYTTSLSCSYNGTFPPQGRREAFVDTTKTASSIFLRCGETSSGAMNAPSHSIPPGCVLVASSFNASGQCQCKIADTYPPRVSFPCGYAILPSSSNATEVDCQSSGEATFTISCQSLPPCSSPVSVPAEACKGGQGLWASKSNEFHNMFGLGTHTECEATGEYYTLYPNGAVSTSEDYDYLEEAGILTRPDGSQCQAESGFQFSVLACPLGWANGCFNEQNSSSSSTEEEPSSSSGEPGESSSSGESDLCSEFPGLPICEGDGGSDGGGSSGSGSGGTCSDLSNCDWAKLDVQLIQLGVGVEIRNSIRDIIGLLNNGYNISQQQLQQLQGLRNDLIGSVGSGVNEIVNAINGLENSLNGIGGGGNISGGVADGLGQFASDTTGSGSLDSLLGSFDFGDGGQMGDSLGDGRGIRNRIKESIGIDSSSFAFLGTGGDCPVFQTSFNTGVMGIRNDGNINLCDVYGFNAASVLRAMMWLIVITSCLFMNLHTLKTGGRS